MMIAITQLKIQAKRVYTQREHSLVAPSGFRLIWELVKGAVKGELDLSQPVIAKTIPLDLELAWLRQIAIEQGTPKVAKVTYLRGNISEL